MTDSLMLICGAMVVYCLMSYGDNRHGPLLVFILSVLFILGPKQLSLTSLSLFLCLLFLTLFILFHESHKSQLLLLISAL